MTAATMRTRMDPRPGRGPRPGRRSRHGRLLALLAALVVATPLLTAAMIGPAAGEVEERYTLTVKLLDHTGQVPCDGCLHSVEVYNDTWEDWQGGGALVTRNRSGFAGDGEHSFEVYDGVYTLFTYLDGSQGVGTADASAARLDMLVAMEVPVHGDTEVTLDAREGVLLTQPEVGQEVQVRSQTTAWCHNRANGLSPDCLPLLDLSGNEGVGRGTQELYVTPFGDWTLQPTWLWEQWHMGEPQPLSPVPNLDPPSNYSPTPAYMYRTALLYDHGASAQDLTDRSFSAADFVEVPTSYHADKPETIIGTYHWTHVAYPWEPKPLRYGGYPSNRVYFEPGEVTEYYLADDRFVWTKRDWLHYKPEPGPHLWGLSMVGQEVYLESEAGTRREVEQHFQAPYQHGAAETNDRYWEHARANDFPIDTYAQIAPGMVRIGDEFFPPYFHNWGSIPGRVGASLTQPFETSWRMWNADTGEELSHPQECDGALVLEECREVPWLFAGMAAAPATYRLEQTDAYPGWMEPYSLTKPSGTSTTVWTFSSARSDAQLPAPEYRCLEEDVANDCQMQPVIQLHYDLGLDAYNRAPAGRRHTFTIEAGPHSEAIGRAPVTEIMVQASFDDGETWNKVRELSDQDQGWNWKGRFRFEVEHPPLAETSGFVSLRVKAEDANGGTVDQCITRAYILEGATDDGDYDGAPCGDLQAPPDAQAPVEGSVTTAAAGAGARVDGVTSQFVEFEVPEGVDNAKAEVAAEYAQTANIDLYLQRQGEDGTWGDDLASGTSGALDGERMTTRRLDPGVYRIEVHNWAGPPLNEVAVTATFFNSEGEPGSD